MLIGSENINHWQKILDPRAAVRCTALDQKRAYDLRSIVQTIGSPHASPASQGLYKVPSTGAPKPIRPTKPSHLHGHPGSGPAVSRQIAY
ncbi:50S ribosomal protein L23 [Anopheles sinensis]|uniref:50S ribosomal protein L23 n=1 Tax=Anopheles sinensis TaxID=74873 RepID=A0A084VKL2_ANOSI|nr:50S ribosomal protein L23 [Anopheles sinensis]